jgi:hypothetical protein
MKQSFNKKEKNRTNFFLKGKKLEKKKQKNTSTIRNFFKTLKNRKNENI